MLKGNQTLLNYFFLEGITDDPNLQAPIFLLVLLVYLLTIAGNMTILQLVCLDAQLHTPMYLLLGNLSVLDMSSTTVTQNRIFSSFLSGDNTISFLACTAQVYVYLSLTGSEIFILTAMSYDRYVAICNPLHYPVVMSRKACALLAAVSWILGFLEVIPVVTLLSGWSCYKTKLIKHFYCDIVPLMELSCSDISPFAITILVEALLFCLPPLSLTFSSYLLIIMSILKISSSTGRRKAFYTCSSHLTVVILFYATLFSLYLTSTSGDTLQLKKLFSMFNTVVVPFLNPLIYSLKNNDVKSALRRQLKYCKLTY